MNLNLYKHNLFLEKKQNIQIWTGQRSVESASFLINVLTPALDTYAVIASLLSYYRNC